MRCMNNNHDRVERFYQLPKQLPNRLLFRVCWFFVRLFDSINNINDAELRLFITIFV